MGTVFVAYGETGRERVLEFAAEQVRKTGDDLYVYHAQETASESDAEVRAEIEATLERTAPDVDAEVVIDRGTGGSDDTNVSKQKRLTDRINDSGREVEYVVMGNVERGAVETFALPSMTEAVLESRDVPVMLVPA